MNVVCGEILAAVGRAPNVEDLNLQAAWVAYDEKGVKVDPTLRTTARHIWACGNLAGPVADPLLAVGSHISRWRLISSNRISSFPG